MGVACYKVISVVEFTCRRLPLSVAFLPPIVGTARAMRPLNPLRPFVRCRDKKVLARQAGPRALQASVHEAGGLALSRLTLLRENESKAGGFIGRPAYRHDHQ